jgi:hypothetical protein
VSDERALDSMLHGLLALKTQSPADAQLTYDAIADWLEEQGDTATAHAVRHRASLAEERCAVDAVKEAVRRREQAVAAAVRDFLGVDAYVEVDEDRRNPRLLRVRIFHERPYRIGERLTAQYLETYGPTGYRYRVEVEHARERSDAADAAVYAMRAGMVTDSTVVDDHAVVERPVTSAFSNAVDLARRDARTPPRHGKTAEIEEAIKAAALRGRR